MVAVVAGQLLRVKHHYTVHLGGGYEGGGGGRNPRKNKGRRTRAEVQPGRCRPVCASMNIRLQHHIFMSMCIVIQCIFDIYSLSLTLQNK